MNVDAISTLGGDNTKPPQFTAREKRDEVAREVNFRKSVYPGQVRQGRLTQAQADRQRAIMYAIWQDYCAIVNGDASEPQSRLDLTPPADHSVARDDNRRPLNAMAHAGDGESAAREAGVDPIVVDAGPTESKIKTIDGGVDAVSSSGTSTESSDSADGSSD